MGGRMATGRTNLSIVPEEIDERDEREECVMAGADEPQVIDRSGDRRSPWTDPHFWVPLAIQAVFMLVSVTTIIVTDRLQIAGQNEKIAAMSGQLTALSGLATSTIETKGDIKALTERVVKLESFESTQKDAYNFNFTTRLAGVEAKVGIQRLTSPQ